MMGGAIARGTCTVMLLLNCVMLEIWTSASVSTQPLLTSPPWKFAPLLITLITPLLTRVAGVAF